MKPGQSVVVSTSERPNVSSRHGHWIASASAWNTVKHRKKDISHGSASPGDSPPSQGTRMLLLRSWQQEQTERSGGESPGDALPWEISFLRCFTVFHAEADAIQCPWRDDTFGRSLVDTTTLWPGFMENETQGGTFR